MAGVKVNSSKELHETLRSDKFKKAAVAFYTPDQPQSQQVAAIMGLLAADHKNTLGYCVVEVTNPVTLSDEYASFKVTKIPTLLLFDEGIEVKRVEGSHAPVLVNAVQTLCGLQPASVPAESVAKVEDGIISLHDRLRSLVQSHPVMLFMKGSHDQPFCRFSKQAVAILNGLGVKFGSFDVFEDDTVRQGMKEFSDWPTFPQLYINGKFIGGVDIMNQMLADGCLERLLSPYRHISPNQKPTVVEKPEVLEQRLNQLIRQAPIMVFMKGDRTAPCCKFSRQLLALFEASQITDFGTFNILEDENVRQGLKVFSDWPTYPQIYVNGRLLGGVDVIQQIADSQGFQGLKEKISSLL